MPNSTGTPSARPAPPLPPDGLSAATADEWLPIWHRVIATTPTKAVGYALMRFAGWSDGASIRPGNAILARMCGCSDKSVRVALGQMRDWGLLWRYHKGTRQGDADTYRLTIPDDAMERVPLLGPDWELPVPPTGAVSPTAPVALTAAVAESVTAVAPTGPLRYHVPPTSTETSTGSLHDEGKGFDLAGLEVARAREAKIPMDDPVKFEAERDRQLKALEEMIRDCQQAS